jgi:RNA polymerase-binding transcription factor DksA
MAIVPLRKTFATSRNALERERARLLAEAAALDPREQGFGSALSEGAESAAADGFVLAADGAGGHAADVATDLFEHELAIGLSHKVKHQIVEVDAALARIGAGTYGVCEDCHEKIDAERLKALPRARRCVPCQRRAELVASGRRGRALAA